MKKLSLLALMLLSWIFSTSCGPNHESLDSIPTQNALLAYGSNEWPISCYFYDPKSRDFGQNLPIWNRAWVWAKTPEGAHIHAQADKKGGFLVADKIYYSKGKKILGVYVDEAGAELMPEVKTTDDMEKICQESIDRYYPNKGYKLIGMVGSRNTQAIANLIENAFPLTIGESQNPNKITRVVIFGDSLSDTGRLKRWLQVMPERPFFLGRFSNGGTWSDFLADEANVAVLNYSTGGAVTKGNVTKTPGEILRYVRDVGRHFITGSIRNFINDYKKNELKDGQIPDAERTLFVLWGGANDFLSKFDTKKEINELIDKPDSPDAGSNSILARTVLNVAEDVKGLASIGAKNILVVNLPDIGATPRMALNDLYHEGSAEDKYAFSEAMSKIVTEYNEKLAAEIERLKSSLSGTKIALFDAAGALKSLMQAKGPRGEPNFDYGIDMNASFTKLSSPNKPDIKVGVNCYKGGYLGSTKASDICPNSARMLFWDDVHPTAMGHCGIAFFLHNLLYDEGWVASKANFQNYQKICR
jgi:phospholipase/lecithinase/hemolysin